MKRLLVCLVLFVLGFAEAGHAALQPPSLTVDSNFAPPTGIVEDDLSTSSDTITDVAAFGGQDYAVGETVDGNGDAGVLVLARNTNGTWDTSFGGGDGKLTIQLATNSQLDLANAVLVLPDGRLRVAAEVDVDASSATNKDVALIGLNADGSYDTGFGGGDGVEIFPVGSSDDSPLAMAVDGAGRIAVTGSTASSNRKDTFVSLRNPDGSPVSSFGTDGIVTLARAAGELDDQGDDVAFRPGGGLVVLMRMDTDPSADVVANASVLHGFQEDGSDDPSFGVGGSETPMDVGGTNTLAGKMLFNRGMLWVAGKSVYGVDQDAFIARMDGAGRGMQVRHFDFRGKDGGTDAVVSAALDLTVLAGPPETLVVVGSVGSADANKWGAAAINTLDGDLASAPFGDVVAATRGVSSLMGAAADSAKGLFTGGTIYDTNQILNSRVGSTRIVLDADKKCDLAVDIPSPLELTFVGQKSSAASISVTNKGTRPCGGTVSLAAPYKLARAISTGVLDPGASMKTGPVAITTSVIKRADDVARFTVSVDGDSDPSNNVRGVRVVFSFCDLGLTAVSRPATVPSEGFRTASVELRNSGTITCRRVGEKVSGGTGGSASKPFSIERGRSASDTVRVGVRPGTRVGKKVSLRVSSTSDDGDPFPANDSFRVSARVVGVGDTRVSSAGARSLSGTASSGHGAKQDRSGLRVTRVEVAVRRLGSGCRWLAGRTARFTTRKTKDCTPSGWQAASGTHSWRLSLSKALPAGRYEVLSRAVTANGFREARFTKSDRNRVAFRVG
jgi:uncharacterized delta-60 repeat protein